MWAEAAAKVLEPNPEPGGSEAPCQLEGINTGADRASEVWKEAHHNPELPWAAGDLPRDPRAGETDECLFPMGPWLGGSVRRRQLSVGRKPRKPHPTPTLKQHALPGASWLAVTHARLLHGSPHQAPEPIALGCATPHRLLTLSVHLFPGK